MIKTKMFVTYNANDIQMMVTYKCSWQTNVRYGQMLVIYKWFVTFNARDIKMHVTYKCSIQTNAYDIKANVLTDKWSWNYNVRDK
jgi:hypothetical protein